MKTWMGLVLMAGVGSLSLAANAARQITFQSKYDTFQLVLSGSHGTIDGKKADLSAFTDLLPVLSNPMSNECPRLSGSPDVTVKENGKARLIYVKAGVVSDGKNCLNVGGEGLYYFPVHREFLIGDKRGTIDVKSPLKVFRKGDKVVEIRLNDGSWEPDGDSKQLLNFDFLEKFINSLKDFQVNLRMQTGLGQDKPKMIVRSGNQNYEFYKITDQMWAMKRPGTHWLISSNDWSFWYDFGPGVIEDRWSNEIKIAEAQDQSKEARMAALNKIEGTWSPNLRQLYHRLVLALGEDPEIQRLAMLRLKRKPSKETAGVMIQYLESGTDEDLKDQAGAILRLYNPKAPRYRSKAPLAEREKALEFWRSWWSQNRKSD
ncbi:MAG: hypothetical protein AB7G93_02975 [Bdellovibrionales bacterium]